jgi:putative colanic acid biosynthesis glycosyltransferase
MLLSVVTVVFNDPEGLLRTAASVQRLMGGDVEHIIIDGSPGADDRFYVTHLSSTDRLVVVEPDNGIYDAMNKGLRRAKGDYILFMNAGDQVHEAFQLDSLADERDGFSRVALGYALESFQNDCYLRPGLGREEQVFLAPSHQATFYPRSFYQTASFDPARTVGADGALTHEALNRHGGVFIPSIVCIFELGGLSSSYSSWEATKVRLRELSGRRKAFQLIKFALWRLMPQGVFYRMLASYKYTRMNAADLDPALLPSRPISFGRSTL